MAKGYIGIGGVAKNVKNIYIGVGGKAKQVRKAYIGVGGVAKLWYAREYSFAQVGLPSSLQGASQPVVGYGAGHFVYFAGQLRYFAYSGDGMTWVQGQLPSSVANMAVAGNDDALLLVGSDSSNSGVVYRSTNGTRFDRVNWNIDYVPTGVCTDGSSFVAVGANFSATSTNGTSWNYYSAASGQRFHTVVYGGGIYIAVPPDGGTYYYSTNGQSWTSGSLPISWQSMDYPIPMCYGNGRFVILPFSGSTGCISTNGTTWTTFSLPLLPQNAWRSVCYGDGGFIAVSYRATSMARSENGSTWSAIPLGTEMKSKSICFGEPVSGHPTYVIAVADSTISLSYTLV